eukprot:2949232-Prymnesium_polylepis.1
MERSSETWRHRPQQGGRHEELTGKYSYETLRRWRLICITYPSTIIAHATATPARHREMLSRAHDTPEKRIRPICLDIDRHARRTPCA